MGLIKAALTSASSSFADAWKDYFVCDSLSSDVLMVKGTRKGKGKSDVITNGSTIIVNEGQCAIVVDDGLVVEVANEPGSYTFDTTKSPCIFDGGFKGLKDTFSQISERFTYGGVTNRSQYVYFINTKEIVGNMYGTPTPVPFKISDPSINLKMEVNLKCNGEYSISITNPILFYKNVAGNSDIFYKENIASMMRSEVLTALQPALAKLSLQGVSMYSDIPLHTYELCENLNEILSNKWSNLRGISIVNFGINSISPKEDELKRIQNLQEGAALRDVQSAAAHLAAAQAQALRDAANNSNGAVNGFMGMNMASQAGGSIADLYAQASQNNAGGFCPYCGKPVMADALFCSSCGKKIK